MLALDCLQEAQLMRAAEIAEKNKVTPARFRHTTFSVDSYPNNYILGLVPWRNVKN